MLFKNDIFELDGVKMRLLVANAESDLAWCINIESQQSWPQRYSYAALTEVAPVF